MTETEDGGIKPDSLCDMSMPHDGRYEPPQSCPPYCPTRLQTESKEDKKWPPTTMETKEHP